MCSGQPSRPSNFSIALMTRRTWYAFALPLSFWMFTLGSPGHGVRYIRWLVPRCRGSPKNSSHILHKSENLTPFGLRRSVSRIVWRSSRAGIVSLSIPNMEEVGLLCNQQTRCGLRSLVMPVAHYRGPERNRYRIYSTKIARITSSIARCESSSSVSERETATVHARRGATPWRINCPA